MRAPASFVRPLVRRLHPYVPGEQPKVQGLIKLNTNENPYPPSPRVLTAVRRAVDARLRLYPNPTSQALRAALASVHGCSPDRIFVGNGSDECLALAVRAFVEPAVGPARGRARGRSLVQYFTPSYSLYPVLSSIHGARQNAVPLAADFNLPSLPALRREKRWRFDAALSLITTPNAPTGRGYSTAALERLCRAQKGLVILDEAYADFAREHAVRLALELPHVLVARTFSKAFSLCFQRVGYLIGHPDLVAALDAIRDSYNVNGLGQIAALETLADLPYYRRNIARIVRTRERLTTALTGLGFLVLPSETNFLFARPPQLPAEAWLGELRAARLLVRWFGARETKDYLRITVGTDREADALIREAGRILERARRGSRGSRS